MTAVVRTGEPVLGNLDELERQFPGVVAKQREAGVQAIAAWPLPGTGSPIGGMMLFYDTPQTWPEAHRNLLDATARRVADAVRRVRVASGRGPGDATPDDPSLIGDGQRASVLLENDPRAPGGARQFLRAQRGAREIDEDTVDT